MELLKVRINQRVGKFFRLSFSQFFIKYVKTSLIGVNMGKTVAMLARPVLLFDEKPIESMAGADNNFAIIGAAMSKDVFNHTPVDVILYFDDHFKDIKTNYSYTQTFNTYCCKNFGRNYTNGEKKVNNNTLYTYSKKKYLQ